MEGSIERIPQLRMCVTEKCECKCFYCRPGGEACRYSSAKEMSLRQIYQLTDILVKNGITHIKITGGEPLLRDDILRMIQLLSSIDNIQDIQLVTRSSKVGKMAKQLKDAGLSCLNFSLDTLDYFTFLKITCNSRLDLLLQAIKVAYKSGLKLKFNMVVIKGVNDNEIPAMIDFVGQYGATLKLLDLMNIPHESKFLANYYMPFDKIVEELKAKAVKWSIEKPPGEYGTPMPRFEMSNGAVVLIKDARIGTWYGDVCVECDNFPCQDAVMALRLTADGHLQRCLLRNDNLVDLLTLIENVEPQEIINNAISLVLNTFHDAVYHEAAWKL